MHYTFTPLPLPCRYRDKTRQPDRVLQAADHPSSPCRLQHDLPAKARNGNHANRNIVPPAGFSQLPCQTPALAGGVGP